ncbi:MAG: hypothetical protein SGPRY_013017 [Prymnesium sp.]
MLLSLAAFARLPFELDSNGCVVDFQPNVNYFPFERRALVGEAVGVQPSSPRFADDFEITYFSNYKVLRNLKAKPKETWVLHHCGTPHVFPWLPDDAVNSTVIEVPVQQWSTGLTIPITFMEELGLLPRASVLSMTYVTSPCAQKLAGCDKITSSNSSAWVSTVKTSGSQVHFTDDWDTGKTGLPIDVKFDASSDKGMLNRAEWVKFAAAFFNKEPEANLIFEGIRSRFEDVNKTTQSARLSGTSSPVAAYVTYNSWESAYRISDDEYLKESILKAGGRLIDSEFVSSWCPLTLGFHYKCANATAIKKVLETIDVVFDDTYPAGGDFPSYGLVEFRGLFNLSSDDATSGAYPFLSNSRLFRSDKRLSSGANGVYGTDFFESAIPHADLFLKDVAAALYPDVFPSHVSRWMRNIALGEGTVSLTAAECTDPFTTCGASVAPPAPPLDINFCLGAICSTATPPPPSPPPTPLALQTSPPSSPIDDDDDETLPIALSAVFGVLVLVMLVTVAYLIHRERAGKPVFVDLIQANEAMLQAEQVKAAQQSKSSS